MAAAAAGAPPPRVPPTVPTLEHLCLHRYLSLLQDACSVFVQLCRSESRLLRPVRRRALPALRRQLDGALSGTASAALRQDMVDAVLDGRYPDAGEFHNQYEQACGGRAGGDQQHLQNGPHPDAFFESEEDLKLMEEVASAGRRCNSVCCTGAFVAEAMVAVVAGPDLKRLDFNLRRRAAEREHRHPFWNRNKLVKKYVTFQVPAVLAHYTKSLREADADTSIKLERLVVKGTDIPSRQFAARKNHFKVLTTYPELESYLEIPGELSRLATAEGESGEGTQYGAFSEHLILSLGEMFAVRGSIGFPRLTEIVLGREACNTSLRMRGRNGRDVSAELFRGIGMACNNLKVLDVSAAVCLAPEAVLFMLFHDAYQTLHQYTYLPEICLNFEDRVVQNGECSLEAIQHHSELKYCPWCLDEWCANGIRQGLEFSDYVCHIVDDRVVDRIKSLHPTTAKQYLVNVVTAKDLVKSAEGPVWILNRPEGPKPWEEDFEPPRPSSIKDWGHYWTEPFTSDCRYEPESSSFPVPVVRPVARSLRCLKLNVDALWPKHELVPFLLRVMPQVKSLGHVNVVRGLKMVRDIVGMDAGIAAAAASLEEIDFGSGGSMTALSSANWAHNEISDFVEDLSQHLYDENLDHPEEKKDALIKDVELVAKHCPNLRRMEVYLYGEIPYLNEKDLNVWRPFAEKLTCLSEIALYAHEWTESVALISSLGNQLRKLFITLDGRGHLWSDDSHRDYVPRLEEVLDLCPNMEDLSFSFGVKRVSVANGRLGDDRKYPSLRRLSVASYMTKPALTYVWARCPNLASLKIESLSMTDAFPQQNAPPLVPFDCDEIRRMLRTNPMKNLREINVMMPVKDIKTAEMMIESLPSVTTLATLSIRVGLPQEDYASQEEMLLGLAHVMQDMRRFKLWCADHCSAKARKVRWRWERTGFLDSIAEIEQLNALIEPGAAL